MAEAPLVSDGKVVSVTSSIVTTPLIRSGPCSDMKGLSSRVAFVKRTSGARSSGAESMRIYEGRENRVVRMFCNRCRIEASSGGWIDLQDSVARVVQGARNVRRGLAIESFSCVF